VEAFKKLGNAHDILKVSHPLATCHAGHVLQSRACMTHLSGPQDADLRRRYDEGLLTRGMSAASAPSTPETMRRDKARFADRCVFHNPSSRLSCARHYSMQLTTSAACTASARGPPARR
jgi:hypothetical protein